MTQMYNLLRKRINIVSKGKPGFSLAALFIFIFNQALPGLAQVQPHMHTFAMPSIPAQVHSWPTHNTNNPGSSGDSNTSSVHQHHWGNNSSTNNNTSTNTSNSTSSGTHHFFHHWQNLDINNTNSVTNNISNQNSALVNRNPFIHEGTQLWTNLSLNSGYSRPSINLDLSSTNSTLTAGRLANGQSIYINVGGTPVNVTAGMKLTPAEYLAVKQVEFNGQQTLVLDSQGSASGGTVVIGQHLSQLVSNLVIPQGVTVIDLTRSGTLNLSGNITDSGTLDIASRNSSLSVLSVNANNINVQKGGILSDTLVPPSGNTNTPINASLNLDAVNDINNAGTISGASSVGLVAGGTITNSGLISSTNGNINIASTTATHDININGTGGTFQALKWQYQFS